MTHPFALNSSAGLRLNLSGLERPASKADVSEKAFNMAVKDKLTAQIMECSNPQQREVLQRLCEDDTQRPARTMYSDIARMDSASPEFTHAVDHYVLQLKQQTLHHLERQLNVLIGGRQPPDLAKQMVRSAVAESRMAALQTVRQHVTENRLLATCIEEHISACDKQRAMADEALFVARLPDTIIAIQEKACALENARNGKESQQKETLLSALQHIIDGDMQRNSEQISSLKKELHAETEHLSDTIEKYAAAMDELDALSKALDRDFKIDIPTEALTEAIRPAIQHLNELYTQLDQTSALLRNAEDQMNRQPVPAMSQNQLAAVKQELVATARAINAIKMQQGNLETSMAGRSGLKDFGLNIKRLFGGGKQEKKLSEYRAELRQCTSQLQKLDKQHQLLSKQVNSSERKQQFSEVVSEHRTMLSRLRQQLTEQRVICQADCELQRQLVQTSYSARRGEIVGREEGLEKALNELTNADGLLKKRVAGDRLGADNFRLLCEVLSDSPALDQVKQHHAQLQLSMVAATDDSPEISALQALKHDCMKWVKLKEISGLDSSGEELQSLYSRLLDNGLDPGEITLNWEAEQPLEQAAQLYALLCVEKIERHPLNERVARAQLLTPRTLTLLDTLEKKIEYMKEKPRQTAKSGLQSHVQGLRRILTQDHDKARKIAEDFSAQFLHAEQDVYVDRQYLHGTCVMHTWNNIIAHLSDNQQMQMTPWRIEKFIQSAVVGSAHQLLGELLDTGNQPRGLSPGAVDQALKQIVRTTELVHPAAVDDFVKHGYVMDYQGEPLRAEGNNLSKKCSYLFDSYGLRSESIPMGRFDGAVAEKERAARLAHLSARNFDAFFIGVLPDSGSGHALALLKSGSGYLLVDSNHDEPISVTLAQLEQYIVNNDNVDESLKQTFAGRDYDKYRTLVFETGFYKGEKG